jgi:hypothetical protein
MRFRIYVAGLLLSSSALVGAQVLMCDRRQGWTMDGEFCARCNIAFAGSVAKKQSFGICLNCSTGCPYEKIAMLAQPDDSGREPAAALPEAGICGLLTPAAKILASAEQIPVALKVDAAAIERLSHRYPIAATFIAAMASTDGAPNIFDAGTVTMGLRHQPREGTASALLERGDAAMQAPFVIELPLFEQVLVEVRGEKLPSGDIGWWVLSSLETKKGTRVLEGPVRIVLTDSGERAATSVGNIGLVAPVMTVATVE